MAKKGGSSDRRGFASMDPAKQKKIASKGGKASHEEGVAHEFTPDEAAEAGRKGGVSVSKNREHMAEIGRAGGRHRGASQSEKKTTHSAKTTRKDSRTVKGGM